MDACCPSGEARGRQRPSEPHAARESFTKPGTPASPWEAGFWVAGSIYMGSGEQVQRPRFQKLLHNNAISILSFHFFPSAGDMLSLGAGTLGLGRSWKITPPSLFAVICFSIVISARK